jgi:hypothetical protein
MAEAAVQTETPAETPTPNASPNEGVPVSEPAAPAGAAPGDGGGTLVETGGTEKEVSAPVDWPSNWRAIMAGGNDKALQRLNRYASPANVWKALEATASKISSGELLRARPEVDPNNPATEEALNEWRAQAGVPEKPEGYLEKVPDGIVFGEEDKPILEDFLKASHEADATPSEVHRALAWYKTVEERQIEALAQRDAEVRARAEDELRAEWGPEYRANMNNIMSLVKTYGNDDLAATLFTARTADGHHIGTDPAILKFLGGLARQINPHGAIPSADSEQGKAMNARKDEIKKLMSDTNSDYYRGPRDGQGNTKLQKEYQDILDAEMRRAG